MNNHQSLSVLIHEIGHFFGFTDQYADFGDSSLVHSTFNRINGDWDSIMSGSLGIHLKCDDVDGMINLLDLR